MSQVYIARNLEELSKIETLLDTTDTLSFDIETTSLSPRRGQIIGFSCACETFSFYVIHKEYVHGELVEVIEKDVVARLVMKLQTKWLITHNGSFDTRFIWHYFGINLVKNIYVDTMLLAHTLDENRFNYGLKQLGAEVFGKDATEAQAAMKESMRANGAAAGELYKADSALIALYGAQDARLTFDLYKYLYPLALEQGLLDFYLTDEVMPLYVNVTIPMELKGIPVDVEALKTSLVEISSDLEVLEARIQAAIAPQLDLFNHWYANRHFPVKLSGPFLQAYAELAAVELPRTKTGAYSFTAKNIESLPDCEFKRVFEGNERLSESTIKAVQSQMYANGGQSYAFNILSKPHLKKLFFEKLKETPMSTTDKGNPQVEEDFLEAMSLKYEWCKDLILYNKLTKIKGTYIERFLEEQEDGIFYPSFFQHRTVSGRYSGNLQQLPRVLEESESNELVRKYNNRIRRFFVSGPEHTFADFDYDSQEVKVFAHVSGEQKIKDIFAKGDDFYSSVCIDAEKLEGYSANKKAPNYLGKVNKPARQKAKAYALGLAFNMSPYKLKFELNCSEAEAQKIYDNYFAAYPNLKRWLDSSKEKALKEGFIVFESGRVRRFPDLKRYYAQYGKVLFDGLELWKRYHETPVDYARMKEISGICKNELNSACNGQIQGLAASITNRAAIKTARMLAEVKMEAYICCVTHDQITVRCPDSELERSCQVLQHAMETAYTISVPLTAPPSWGKNMAESK